MSNVRYSLENLPAQKTHGILHYISESECGEDWHSTPHTHTHMELFYIMGGTGKLWVDGETVSVGEDDVVIVNPGVPHTEYSAPDGPPLQYVVLGVEGTSFSGMRSAGGYFSCRGAAQRQEIRFYISDLLRELQERAQGYEAACQGLFEALIVKVTRCVDNVLANVVSEKTNRECSAVRRYLDTNYKENITLESLAQMTHINKYYLAHAFRRFMGFSPISYLIMRRMEESKSLLETTDYSISQVAGIVGFSSQSYFSQIFKKNTGETPNEYRKRVKAQRPSAG